MATTVEDYRNVFTEFFDGADDLGDWEVLSVPIKLYRALVPSEKSKMQEALAEIIEVYSDSELTADIIHVAYSVDMFSDKMYHAVMSRKCLNAALTREIQNYEAMHERYHLHPHLALSQDGASGDGAGFGREAE